MDKILATRLKTWINAGHPGLYLQSNEDDRINDLLTILATQTGFNLLEWNQAWGWVSAGNKQPTREQDNYLPDLCADLAGLLDEDLENRLIVIKNAREALSQNPVAVARLQQLLLRVQRHHCGESCVILLDERVEIPALIEPLVTRVTVSLPTRDEIAVLTGRFANAQGLVLDEALIGRIGAVLTGLTVSEIHQTLAVAMAHHQGLDESALETLLAEKEQKIARSGVLEMVKVSENLDDIGGLENLKAWLKRKAGVLHRLAEAESKGLQSPRGVLVAGMPGCGKSLTAKAVANLFQLPLLRLDIGSLLGKYVGESEHNMRRALAMAESISPCVLWVDELEKAFVGIGGNNTSEVTSRLLGYFLTWMQEKTGAVFVVATANNISALPPELLRKGRFDDVFYVGFPHISERMSILSIHLKDMWQDLSAEEQRQLAVKCRDFAGADIRNAVTEAREEAFLSGQEMGFPHLLAAIEHTVPLRETLRDQVSHYETLFEKMKLKAASLNEGLSLAQMIALADDPNPYERVRVARNEECSVDLFIKLSRDNHLEVRNAVFNNPDCPSSILSTYLEPIDQGAPVDHLFSIACLHRNAPESLMHSLIAKDMLPASLLQSLVERPHCSTLLLEDAFRSGDEALQTAVLRHPHCSLTLRANHIADHHEAFRSALASNPAITDEEQKILLSDRNPRVRIALAYNRHLSEATRVQLSRDDDIEVRDAFIAAMKAADPSVQTAPQGDCLSTLSPLRLVALAGQNILTPDAQLQIIRESSNEAVLATLAANTVITADVQRKIAQECPAEVRNILATNPSLTPELQMYLYDTGMNATKVALMLHPFLSKAVQDKVMIDWVENVIEALALNPNLHPEHQTYIVDNFWSLSTAATLMARNPALSKESQEVLYQNFDNNEVNESLSLNPMLSPSVFNSLVLYTMNRIVLARNPHLSAEQIKKLVAEETNFSDLAMNPACDEQAQMRIYETATGVHGQLATNPSLAPSVQIMLAKNGVAGVLVNLLGNPALTSKVRDLVVERSQQDPALIKTMLEAIKSLLESQGKHFDAIAARKGEAINKLDGGIIKEVNCIQDLIDNERSREFTKELARLRRLLALLKGNAD